MAPALRSHPLRHLGVSDARPDAGAPRRREARGPCISLTLQLGGLQLSLPLLGGGEPGPSPRADTPRHGDRPREAAAGEGTAADPWDELAELRQLLREQEPGLGERLEALGEPLSPSLLRRWLHARSGDVAAAAWGLLAHAAWRAAFVGAAAAGVPGAAPARGIPEESIAAELAAKKVFLQGLDRGGNAVVLIQAARHDMGARDLAQTKRLICYVLDNAAAVTADPAAGKLCVLFDLSSLRPRNLDVKALLAIFELLQQHYPERLHTLLFLNAPLIFWGVWRIVSPFVQPATREKISFVGGAGARRQLLERIPSQVLPTEFGGHAPLVPIEQAVASWRAQQAQHAQQPQQAGAAAEGAAGAAHAEQAGGGGGHAVRARLAAAAARHSAGRAGRAVGGFVSHKVWRPVSSAARGAARHLRHHHATHHTGSSGGSGSSGGGGMSLQQGRARLLGSMMLTHVLLLGLLLRVLQRVLGLPMRQAASPPMELPMALPAAEHASKDREALPGTPAAAPAAAAAEVDAALAAAAAAEPAAASAAAAEPVAASAAAAEVIA